MGYSSQKSIGIQNNTQDYNRLYKYQLMSVIGPTSQEVVEMSLEYTFLTAGHTGLKSGEFVHDQYSEL